jgi:hypothetical protein
MKMTQNANRTSAYAFTLEGDYSELQNCCTLNALKESLKGTGKYVQLRGRKPKVKQTVRNYWTGQTRFAGYDFGGNVVGGLKNATQFDVYVREYRY